MKRKKCRKCKHFFPLSQYCPAKVSRRNWICRKCDNEQVKKRRRDYPRWFAMKEREKWNKMPAWKKADKLHRYYVRHKAAIAARMRAYYGIRQNRLIHLARVRYHEKTQSFG